MKKLIVHVFLILFLGTQSDVALPSIRVQITPPFYEKEVRPGEKLEFEIALKNNNSERSQLKGYIQSIEIDKNGGLLFDDHPYQKYSCQNWIDLNPRQILLEPGQSKKVAVYIQVPDHAEGGHYATVMFDVEKDNMAREKNHIGLTVRTGTMILLKIIGTLQHDAEILSFQISEHNKKSIFEILIKNKSNVHIKPIGSIVIFNEDNRVIDRINFEENNFIMPQGERIFRCTWDNPKKRMKQRAYKAECRIAVRGLGKRLIENINFFTYQ